MRVFERDGWACHICRGDIDRALAFPHRDSATVDHVIPLTAGGAHSYENCRAAHYRCNSRKGSKVIAS